MQIRRILLRNLHSIRQQVEIDFTAGPLAATGLFAITGDTGAGKTTILDAITLALYGKICRNSNEHEAMSYGAEEALAECEFEAKNRRFLAQWRIRRTRSKKENNFKTERSVAEEGAVQGEFHIVAERKVREIDSFIEEVTGLDFQRFTRSVLLAQGEFAVFLKAPPKERSELLERITGTEVYSRLSIAALDRFRIEEKKRDELKTQQQSLTVFSKEEVRERKASLKLKNKENQQARKSLDESKLALQWLRLVEKLREQQAVAQAGLTTLETEKTKVQADLERLARHRKTLPLHPTLARLDDKETETAQLETAIAGLSASAEDLQEKEAAAKAGFDAKNEDFNNLKASQPAALSLFEEVAGLDNKIENNGAVLTKQKKEQEEWQAAQHHAQAQKTALENSVAGHEARIEALAHWLKEHAAWESLPQDLKPIQLLRDQLRENLRKQKGLTEDKTSLAQRLETARSENEKLQASLAREQSALSAMLEQFDREAPSDFVPNRHDLLEKLNQEIETLGEQHKNFSQLNGLSEAYSNTLAELSEIEAALDNLRQEEMAHEKSLLSMLEASEEWGRQLKFKEQVYRQQLQIANYEKDRASLPEGEPCPLCLSTHHPFREHGAQHFTDEAKLELEAAELEHGRRQQALTDLLNLHREVNSQIRQISASPDGQLGKLHARLHDLERKIAAMFPGLEAEDFSRSHGQWLVEKVSGFEKNLSLKKQVRTNLLQLHRQITDLETALRKLEDELKGRQFEALQWQNNLKDKEAALRDLQADFQQTEEELNRLVSKYGYQFSMDGANGMFTELEAKEKDFSNKKEERNGHERQLELDRQALGQTVKALDEASMKCQILADGIAAGEMQLGEMQSKRRALFGDKKPQVERELLMKQLDDREKALAAARSVFENTKAALALARQSLKNHQERLSAARQALDEIGQSLAPKLATAGFETIGELRLAILPEAEAARIEESAELLKQRETELRQQLKSTGTELAAALKNPLTEQPREELEQEIAALETAMQEIQQSIGALQQQLKDNDARQEAAKILLEQFEKQQETYNRWKALNDLIGSYSGQKFRIFAQGLTLQKLVQLANAHLTNLYGRYVVLKRPGEDLELDILDTYQADSTRSMHTLSGGESFLVSLALALGLSDLAGRNANIRSLFIDEGFGTLDDQALDLAITTLENLQAKGKTIGIISHVKELKERIAVQVRVVKKGGGTSVVEVMDG